MRDPTGAVFDDDGLPAALNLAQSSERRLFLSGPVWSADGDVTAFVGVEYLCYPDCNFNRMQNMGDFGCFLTQFAIGNVYADCNGNRILNIADFGCWQTVYALGCPQGDRCRDMMVASAYATLRVVLTAMTCWRCREPT